MLKRLHAQILYYLYTSKPCGADGTPTRVLKEYSFQIAPKICELFNHSLYTGHIPSESKFVYVTPVYKNNRKEPAESCRPIPLLPILAKVLEHGVCFRPYNHVKHQITKYQHGFLRQRSCVTQLLFLLHDIGKSLDKNIRTDIIYLDFAKAFDSVDHSNNHNNSTQT